MILLLHVCEALRTTAPPICAHKHNRLPEQCRARSKRVQNMRKAEPQYWGCSRVYLFLVLDILSAEFLLLLCLIAKETILALLLLLLLS